MNAGEDRGAAPNLGIGCSLARGAPKENGAGFWEVTAGAANVGAVNVCGAVLVDVAKSSLVSVASATFAVLCSAFSAGPAALPKGFEPGAPPSCVEDLDEKAFELHPDAPTSAVSSMTRRFRGGLKELAFSGCPGWV